MNRLLRLAASVLFAAVTVVSAEEPDYSVTDPELKVVKIDSDPTASFLSVRADTMGRLFVGGRESLFVYEPDDKGGYKPRRELYKFPDHTWVNDIEVRGKDLYVLTVAALYVIPDAVVKRQGLKPVRLLWGIPRWHVHQCFHGLAWGPAGDLYISFGDPLVYYGDFSRPDHWGHWTFFHQPRPDLPPHKIPYTGVGGVLRMRQAGFGIGAGDLEVVAGGTRNSCGLCFDRHWNLFTNDNDHESIPADFVPGRVLYVTPHVDFAWPRGWMPYKTPQRADLLSDMFTGMGRAVPVGQAYYDDALLPAKYRNNLLIARWGVRALTRYPLKADGASFTCTEEVLLAGRNQARPSGVCVGRGGRIFVTIAYMAHNENSPIYRSDLVMITRADDPATHPFEPYEAGNAEIEKLWSELANPSWSRRYAAHVEILRRGRFYDREATRKLGEPMDELLRDHLPYVSAAAMTASYRSLKPGKEAGEALMRLMEGSDPILRRHATRALADLGWQAQADLFVKRLGDSDPQTAPAALTAFFRFQAEPPAEVISGPARSTDRRVRQTACILLARKAKLKTLEELCAAKDVPGRLAGVLAAGFRLTLPPATKPLAADLPLQPWPNPQEAYVLQFADAKIDLREHGRLGVFTLAEHWKAGRRSADDEAVFALLKTALEDADEPVRLQAAHFLSLLNDPRSEPTVKKVLRAGDERRLSTAPLKGVGKVWLAGPFPDGAAGFRTPHPPEQELIDLSAKYGAVQWKEVAPERHFDLRKLYGPADRSSFYALTRLESPSREKVLLLVGSDDGVKVWHNGREVWVNDITRGALPFQDAVVLDLQPGGNDILVRVRNIDGECGLYLHYRAAGGVVVRLPEKADSAGLAERLKAAAGPVEIGPEFLAYDWPKSLASADAVRGRQLFGALGCAKCHGIAPDSTVTGGPGLAGAKKRFAVNQLVESVLLPGKEVSPIFRATQVKTTDDRTLVGLVLSETAEKMELLLADTTRKTIPKTEIAARKLVELSPMPAGLVKTPEELRDLLAYLLSDNPQPP